MGFTEKMITSILVVTLIVFGWYGFDVYDRIATGQTAVDDFSGTMWFMFIGYIVLAIAAAVVTGIVSHLQGDELEDDERDRLFEMKSEKISSMVQTVGLMGLLVLVISEYSAFVIAHAILGVLVLATVISLITRLYFYRRGY